MAVIKNFRKWRVLSWSERGVWLEALLLLGMLRAAILHLPFRSITRILKLTSVENQTLAPLADNEQQRVLRLGWALRSAAARTPWESACLVQGLAGMVMLRRRRYSGILYLGVAKNGAPGEGFAAHAWLRCGEIFLTGEAGHEKYSVLSRYSYP